MRAIRCKSCGSRFYTATKVDTCQDCTGDHDPFKQADRDAAIVKKVNARQKSDQPQSVDPRNPNPKKKGS